jgi:hypothetical protein
MRTLRLLLTFLAALGALFTIAGCPDGSDDDDASAADDDDTTDLGDDDDNTPVPDDDDTADDDDTPTGDPCDDVVDITANVDGEHYLGDTTGAGDNIFGSCSNTSTEDVTLSFVAPATAEYTVSTWHPGTHFDTLVFAFTSCAAPDDSELACNDDIAQNVQRSRISFDADAGDTVYVVVEGYDKEGAFELSVTSDAGGDDDDSATTDDDDSATTDDDDSATTDDDDALDDDDSAASDDDDSAASDDDDSAVSDASR